MTNVEVGPFRLPGIAFEKGQLSDELNAEMIKWANAEGVGMSMTPNLWSFKKEAHRDWFILRWSDEIPIQELKSDEFARHAKNLIGSLNTKVSP